MKAIKSHSCIKISISFRRITLRAYSIGLSCSTRSRDDKSEHDQSGDLKDTCCHIFRSCVTIGTHDPCRYMAFTACWPILGQPKIREFGSIILSFHNVQGMCKRGASKVKAHEAKLKN